MTFIMLIALIFCLTDWLLGGCCFGYYDHQTVFEGEKKMGYGDGRIGDGRFRMGDLEWSER